MPKLRDLICETAGCPKQGCVLRDQWIETMVDREVDQICESCHQRLTHVFSAVHIGRGDRDAAARGCDTSKYPYKTTAIGQFAVHGVGTLRKDGTADTMIMDVNSQTPVAFTRGVCETRPDGDSVVRTTNMLVRDDFKEALEQKEAELKRSS